jgi:hypothetical protein
VASRSFRRTDGRSLSLTRVIFVLLGIGCAAALGQNQAPSPATPPTVDEIVRRMVEHNRVRESRLRYYTSRRQYHVEYRGFPSSMDASMEVEMDYDAPSKNFRVLSESGSHALINHVLKKLLKSEQEAATNQRDNTLSPANYNFAFLETTIDSGRELFVLRVEPKVERKFLYRGKIWVDAEDFAVVKIEATPAQNPSFWIRDTQIEHRYSKSGDFWLPKQNTSVTRVRMGGTATLTINYESYAFPRAANQILPSTDHALIQ